MSSETRFVTDEIQERGNGREAELVPDMALEHPEEIHLPPPSIGPIIVGLGTMLLLLGIIVPVLLPIGLIVAVLGALKMANFEEIDLHPQWLRHLNDRKLGMWIFLASEVMFFGALIGAFISFKVKDGFEEAQEILSLPLATVGTSVLIISSFAVVMGLEAIQSNDRRVFRNWLVLAVALGLTFLSIQAFEWYELMHEDITAGTLFGSAFYLTTGFHGMHVAGGVGWLILLLLRSRRYSASNYLGVELFGLYWHFVDIVWIVLFTVIYLIH